MSQKIEHRCGLDSKLVRREKLILNGREVNLTNGEHAIYQCEKCGTYWLAQIFKGEIE